MCVGLQTQNFEFLSSQTIFFKIFNNSISHMYDLDYIVLQHSIRIFISFQKIYIFTRLFSTDFVLSYIFCWGRSKFSLWSNNLLNAILFSLTPTFITIPFLILNHKLHLQSQEISFINVLTLFIFVIIPLLTHSKHIFSQIRHQQCYNFHYIYLN